MKDNFISKRITDLRMAKDISEYKLSQSIGKCNNYINKVSSGTITPTIDTLNDICEYFGITLSQFFQEENPAISLNAAKIIAILPHLTDDQLQSLLTLINSIKE